MINALSRLKKLAMILEGAKDPALRRWVMHRYLETLYTLAMAAYPPLRPFGSVIGTILSKPTREMQEALLEGSNREVPRLFGDVFKATRRGRPPTTRSERLCWARASALITILMKNCGKTEEEAARLVERDLRKRGLSLPATIQAGAPAWKRLQSWRDKCVAGQKGSFPNLRLKSG